MNCGKQGNKTNGLCPRGYAAVPIGSAADSATMFLSADSSGSTENPPESTQSDRIRHRLADSPPNFVRQSDLKLSSASWRRGQKKSTLVILGTCYCPLRYVLLSFQVRVTVLSGTCYCPLRCVLLSSQVRVTALSDTCCFSFSNVLPSFRVCVTFQIRFKSKMRINIDITAALRAVLVKTTRNIL